MKLIDLTYILGLFLFFNDIYGEENTTKNQVKIDILSETEDPIKLLDDLRLAGYKPPVVPLSMNQLKNLEQEQINSGKNTTKFCPKKGTGKVCMDVRVTKLTPPSFPKVFSRLTALQCTTSVNCDFLFTQDGFETFFRTFDGSCNNLQHTTFGMMGQQMRRIVPAPPIEVVPGTYPPHFRTAPTTGNLLPPARALSDMLFRTRRNPRPNNNPADGRIGTILNNDPVLDRTSRRVTLLFMVAAQLLDHDLTMAPVADFLFTKLDGQPGRDCCDVITVTGVAEHTNTLISNVCLPISMSNNQPLPFPLNNANCMDFVKSERRCSFTDPFNIRTSWIDGSMIYGSSQTEAMSLRVNGTGQNLNLTRNLDGSILPFTLANATSNVSNRDFVAGDLRVAENPPLIAITNIFAREHNRIADRLSRRTFVTENSQNAIFENARKIMIAEWQSIIYNEFLPIVLGADNVRRHGLIPQNTIYNNSELLDPSIELGFSTAAFRFGHTLATSLIPQFSDQNRLIRTFRLINTTLNSDIFFQIPDFHDGILRGAILTPSARYDNEFTADLRNNVLGSPFLDLGALNVQRGRDHNIGFYRSYRRVCQLSDLPLTFNEIRPTEISRRRWNLLSRTYRSPSDIELFPGGILERGLNGSLVGPTFACLIAEQFKRLMIGDRFFFSHLNTGRDGFTRGEINSFNRRRMRDVICENTNIRELPQNVFLLPNRRTNRLIPCTQVNEIDI